MSKQFVPGIAKIIDRVPIRRSGSPQFALLDLLQQHFVAAVFERFTKIDFNHHVSAMPLSHVQHPPLRGDQRPRPDS